MADGQPQPTVAAVPAAPRGGRNVPVAIAVGVVLVAWIAVTLLWWHWGFALFIAIALTAGVWEVTRALGMIGMRVNRWPLLIGTPAMVLASYAVGADADLAVVVAGLSLITLCVIVSRMAGTIKDFVVDIAGGLFTLAYLPLLGSAFVLMLAEPRGAQQILSFLLCVVAADTGAYAVGSMLGRHKMVPRISPGKTWEGLAGGALAALLVGIAMALWVLSCAWWIGALLGLAMALTATVGDLIESMIKREAGLKDMSHLLPGHGGAMDRLDSLLTSAPVAWLLLLLLL